jgi:predicted transposase YdaD
MTDDKNNSKVVNPHDKVFREVYSNKENARSLLADKLPDNVLKLVDLDTMEISKDSFIEKELADFYSGHVVPGESDRRQPGAHLCAV